MISATTYALVVMPAVCIGLGLAGYGLGAVQRRTPGPRAGRPGRAAARAGAVEARVTTPET